MLRRQTRILGRAREALQGHWRLVEAAEQGGIRMEEGQEVDASLVLAVLLETEDVL